MRQCRSSGESGPPPCCLHSFLGPPLRCCCWGVLDAAAVAAGGRRLMAGWSACLPVVCVVWWWDLRSIDASSHSSGSACVRAVWRKCGSRLDNRISISDATLEPPSSTTDLSRIHMLPVCVRKTKGKHSKAGSLDRFCRPSMDASNGNACARRLPDPDRCTTHTSTAQVRI